MHVRPPGRRFALLAIFLAAACTDWPRFENLPDSADTGALPAGADPSQAIDVDWTGPYAHADNGSATGLPIDPLRPIALDQGLVVQGLLSGSGWSDTASPIDGDCGELDFPAGGAGTYLGDVDWVGLSPGADATLCAELELSRDGVQLDVVPYLLDSCDQPAQAIRDDDDRPVGQGYDGPLIAWSTPVSAGQPVGVLVAAYWPQGPELEADWRMGLSLVAGSVCPQLPEAP